MSRPVKCRKVCYFPENQEFYPSKEFSEKSPVVLNIDEYEAVRLLDKEGMTQEECCRFMRIGRTTVQRIYDNARKKLAVSLVEGRPIQIKDGDYWLCDGKSTKCSYEDCMKRKIHAQYQKEKGQNELRVAVAYENGTIFQHFGHTKQFKVYDAANGKVAASAVVDTDGSGHSVLAGVLSVLQVDALICGSIGL